MNQFQHHPDDLIYVRTDAATYGDTLENFALDFAEAEPALPSGATARLYRPGIVHSISGAEGVIAGGPLTWDFGDRAIAAVAALIAAQTLRNTPPPNHSAEATAVAQSFRASQLREADRLLEAGDTNEALKLFLKTGAP